MTPGTPSKKRHGSHMAVPMSSSPLVAQAHRKSKVSKSPFKSLKKVKTGRETPTSPLEIKKKISRTPKPRKSAEACNRRLSAQFGPGGSCDSQTDSQTPWIDELTDALPLQGNADSTEGTNCSREHTTPVTSPAAIRNVTSAAAVSPPDTAPLTVVNDVDALAPSSTPTDEASVQRQPLLRRCSLAIKDSEQDCLGEVKTGQPMQEEGVSLAMIADDIDDNEQRSDGSSALGAKLGDIAKKLFTSEGGNILHPVGTRLAPATASRKRLRGAWLEFAQASEAHSSFYYSRWVDAINQANDQQKVSDGLVTEVLKLRQELEIAREKLDEFRDGFKSFASKFT